MFAALCHSLCKAVRARLDTSVLDALVDCKSLMLVLLPLISLTSVCRAVASAVSPAIRAVRSISKPDVSSP